MIHSAQVPLLRFVVGLILGISLSSIYNVSLLWCFLVLTISVILCNYLKNSNKWLYYLVLHLSIISSGFILNQLKNEAFQNLPNKSGNSFLVLKSLGSSEKSNKYLCNSNGSKALLYTHPSWQDKLEVGRRYFSENLQFHKISKSIIPGKFDYYEYLKNKSWNYTAYLGKGEKLVRFNNRHWFHITLYKVQSFLRQKIKFHHSNSDLEALCFAILLGDKSELAPETQDLFANLGISHFLAVSGLHVGIIYWLISLVLGLSRFRKHKWFWFKVLLALVAIWFYAFLSGFSMSVTRASFMFSCFLLARGFKKNFHPINVLSLSAIFWLFINPGNLFDVGFQLSYAAVAGILILYPLLSKLWQPRFLVLDSLWSVVSVSLSAQLATLPFILFYFAKFPLWFLLSNIWLAIFSFVLTTLIFLFAILSYVPLLAGLIATLSEMLFELFFWGLNIGGRIGVTIVELSVDLYFAIALGLFIIALIFYLSTLEVLKSGVVLLLVLVVLVLNPDNAELKDREMYLVEERNKTYYLYKHKNEFCFFSEIENKTLKNTYIYRNLQALIGKDKIFLPANWDPNKAEQANLLVRTANEEPKIKQLIK